MQNPFTREAFLAWVERQPAEQEYVFADNYNCALAQYGKFLGFADATSGVRFNADESTSDYIRHDIHQHHYFEGISRALVDYPQTFGALAERLRG